MKNCAVEKYCGWLYVLSLGADIRSYNKICGTNKSCRSWWVTALATVVTVAEGFARTEQHEAAASTASRRPRPSRSAAPPRRNFALQGLSTPSADRKRHEPGNAQFCNLSIAFCKQCHRNHVLVKSRSCSALDLGMYLDEGPPAFNLPSGIQSRTSTHHLAEIKELSGRARYP